jgi:hypothetical protein
MHKQMRVVVVLEYNQVEPGSSDDEGISLNVLTSLEELRTRYNADNVSAQITFEE